MITEHKQESSIFNLYFCKPEKKKADAYSSFLFRKVSNLMVKLRKLLVKKKRNATKK